jgi:hypothetical protein
MEKRLRFDVVDKSPRPGCIESGKYPSWQCCEFHRELSKSYDQMRDRALKLTFEKFPDAKQDMQAPFLVWIKRELMSVMSTRWWLLMAYTFCSDEESCNDP